MAASLHGLPCSLLPPAPSRASQCRPLALTPSAASGSPHSIPGRQASSRQHARWHQAGPSSSSPCLLQASSSKSGGQEVIQGYTPANYISYSDKQEHACRCMIGVSVQAPVSVCFDLWNDWARLVDFLDLISQIGLDPDEPDMGLFQCFYRWGRMPVMEIVFLARKAHVEEDKLIQFETVWGLPAQGQIEFIEDGPNNTTVLFRFEHQMPVLLVELKVGVLNMETHLKSIFAENMEDFKQLAEMLAREPGNAPPRRTAETRKAAGASGAPQAMPPTDEQRPWVQQAQQAQNEQQAQQQTPQHKQQAQHEQRAQQQASTSSSEEGSAHQTKRAGPSRRGRASPTPSSSQQQPLQQQQQQQANIREGDGAEGRARKGRPRSRKPSATPPPSQGSAEQVQGSVSEAVSQGGASTQGSGEEGMGDASNNGTGQVKRRSRKSPARSSSPSASKGQPTDSPPPASSKGRKSRSATNSQ